MPLVSVIITTKNEEDYIESCLKSIRNQTHKNIEIILVDSCSMDKTVEKARKYANKIIIKECTPSEGRNLGARYAKSDILLFIDADIVLTKNWVLQMTRSIKRGVSLIGKLLARENTLKAWLMNLLFYVDVLVLRIIGIPTTIGGLLIAIKRNVFDALNGFCNTPGEDAELLKRARCFGKVVFDSNCLALTSIRRFERKGYLKQSLIWVFNWFMIIFGLGSRLSFQEYFK